MMSDDAQTAGRAIKDVLHSSRNEHRKPDGLGQEGRQTRFKSHLRESCVSPKPRYMRKEEPA